MFTPDRTAIETLDGTVVEERLDPLSSCAGQVRSSPWDAMRALYFATYASWNSFVVPFIYRSSGISTREIEKCGMSRVRPGGSDNTPLLDNLSIDIDVSTMRFS